MSACVHVKLVFKLPSFGSHIPALFKGKQAQREVNVTESLNTLWNVKNKITFLSREKCPLTQGRWNIPDVTYSSKWTVIFNTHICIMWKGKQIH